MLCGFLTGTTASIKGNVLTIFSSNPIIKKKILEKKDLISKLAEKHLGHSCIIKFEQKANESKLNKFLEIAKKNEIQISTI